MTLATLTLLNIPVILLVVHFVGDFIGQSDWMALNKSKRWDALAFHVTVYSACFLSFGWRFVIVTWITHFITDAITSRITSRLWFFRQVPGVFVRDLNSSKAISNRWVTGVGNRHWFFVMIGLDQLIHAITLAFTYALVAS